MEVFIANGTMQHREFHYRILEQPTVRVLKIGAGQQERLAENLEGEQLQYVLDQLQGAGAVPVSDIGAIKTPYSLVYDVRRPIKTDKIDEARARDVDVRQDIAGDKVEQAGLVAFEGMRRTIAKAGGDPSKLEETTLEVVQLKDSADEERQRGGVDAEVTVSKKHGDKPARSRRGR
jgi:hypothetical protein